MPSADYILTVPCSELASNVEAAICDPGGWVTMVGGPQGCAGTFYLLVSVAFNCLMLWLAAKYMVRAVKFVFCEWRETPAWKAVLCVAVMGIAYHGMTKAFTGRVYFPRTDMEVAYLIDNGSFVSNNLVHVDFTTFLIPQTAPITLAYWPNESTNEEEFVELFTRPIQAWPRPLEFEFENATSNRWYCYTTWTPGPAVHTNGVWQQTGMTDRRNKRDTILIRTLVMENGEQIAPPRFQQTERSGK